MLHDYAPYKSIIDIDILTLLYFKLRLQDWNETMKFAVAAYI